MHESSADTASASRRHLSVIIPVYNERDNLMPLAERLFPVVSSLGYPYEVIFVDDGSTDGSSEILRTVKSQHLHVRVLHLDRNHGLTAAFDAGFKAASGEILVTMDSDLQNDPEDIPLLLNKLDEGECDSVIGWRKRRNDRFLRRISSKIANSVRNLFLHESVPDSACSLKAFKRECIVGLKLYSGMHRFFPRLLEMEGYKVGQVVVQHHPRLHGKSKYNIRNRILRAFIDLLAVAWMQKRRLTYKVREDET
jgi:glycosyltransferase involved in cell wall biosynthesis